MENNNGMTAERSLEIIRKSIEQSRRDATNESGAHFILWGVLVTVTALLVGHLWMHYGGPVWNWLWLVMWVAGYILSYLLGKKLNAIPRPKTFIDKIAGFIWLSFGIFTCSLGTILSLVIGFLRTQYVQSDTAYLFPMTAVIILMFGLCSTITGFVLRSKLIVVCGILSGFCGFVGSFLVDGAYQMLVMAAASLVGLVMPGLIILIKNRR